MVKQLGRWRSDIVAQGYIENSMHNREMIYNGIIQKPRPSTQTNPLSSAQFRLKPGRKYNEGLSSAEEVIINPGTSSRDGPLSFVQDISNSGTNCHDKHTTSLQAINNPETNSQQKQSNSTQVINSPGIDSRNEQSTDAQAITNSGTDNDDFHIDWAEFEEDFTVDHVNSIQQGKIIYLITKIYYEFYFSLKEYTFFRSKCKKWFHNCQKQYNTDTSKNSKRHK